MAETGGGLVRIGIDVGGTKVAAGLVAADGALLGWSSQPTQAHRGTRRVAERTADLLADLLARSGLGAEQVAAVGVGLCGDFDPVTGEIKTAPNTPQFVGTRPQAVFAETLGARLGLHCPVRADNDASVAALAEGRLGAGRGVERLFYVTISTGIGGARFDGRKVVNAEPGVYLFPDPEHPRTSLNDLAGGMALAHAARSSIRRFVDQHGEKDLGRLTHIFELCQVAGTSLDERLEQVTARTLGDAARCGDAFAQRLLATAARCVARGLAMVLEEEMGDERIVVGGSLGLKSPGFLAQVGDFLRDLQRRAAPGSALNRFDVGGGVVPAVLGDERGVLGAAALTRLPPPPPVQLLLTGADSEAGHRLLKRLERRWRVLGSFETSPRPGLTRLDLADREAVTAMLEAVQPAVVVDGSALSGEPLRPTAECPPPEPGAGSAQILSEACRRTGCRLVAVVAGTDARADAAERLEVLAGDPTDPGWADALATRLGRLLLATGEPEPDSRRPRG